AEIDRRLAEEAGAEGATGNRLGDRARVDHGLGESAPREVDTVARGVRAAPARELLPARETVGVRVTDPRGQPRQKADVGCAAAAEVVGDEEVAVRAVHRQRAGRRVVPVRGRVLVELEVEVRAADVGKALPGKVEERVSVDGLGGDV